MEGQVFGRLRPARAIVWPIHGFGCGARGGGGMGGREKFLWRKTFFGGTSLGMFGYNPMRGKALSQAAEWGNKTFFPFFGK